MPPTPSELGFGGRLASLPVGACPMNLSHLLPDLMQNPFAKRLVKRAQQGESAWVDDLPYAARPALIAAIASQVDRSILVVSSRADRSDVLSSAVTEFLDGTRPVIHWPAPPALPYERLPRDSDQSADYVSALLQISSDPNRAIAFVSAASVTHAVLTPSDLQDQLRTIRKGEIVRQDRAYRLGDVGWLRGGHDRPTGWRSCPKGRHR